MWERQPGGQTVQREAPDLTDFVSVGRRLTRLDLAGEDDEDDGGASLRIHAHQAGEPHGHAQLLEHLTYGGLFHHLATVDVACRKAPPAGARLDAAFAEENAAVVAKDYRHGHLGVAIVNEATRGARWPFTVFLVARHKGSAASKTEAVIAHASSESGSSSRSRA